MPTAKHLREGNFSNDFRPYVIFSRSFGPSGNSRSEGWKNAGLR